MLEKIAFALKIDTPQLFSIEPIQFSTAKSEIEEQVWLNIGQNISNYISKNLMDLKKQKYNEKIQPVQE